MLNNVVLMGRLTADPELKQTPSGVSVCQFTVAIDRDFTGQNGERQTDFINVVAWRQTAEFISRYFAKGRMIAIIGSLRTRTYDDKRYPDVKHYVTEVYADRASFTGEKKQDDNGGGNYQNNGGYGGNYQQQQSRPNNNGYNNVQQQPPQNTTVGVGDLSDFEEVISDSDLPF